MNSAFRAVKWKATGGIKQNIGMLFTFEQGHFDCYFEKSPKGSITERGKLVRELLL